MYKHCLLNIYLFSHEFESKRMLDAGTAFYFLNDANQQLESQQNLGWRLSKSTHHKKGAPRTDIDLLFSFSVGIGFPKYKYTFFECPITNSFECNHMNKGWYGHRNQWRCLWIISCRCRMAEEVILKEKPVVENLMNRIFYYPPDGKTCSILHKLLLFWVSCNERKVGRYRRKVVNAKKRKAFSKKGTV